MRPIEKSITRCYRATVVIFSILSSSCANLAAPPRANEFVYKFGIIEFNGERNEIVDQGTTIVWQKGVNEPRIGASVQNLAKNRFDLAYVILRKFDQGSRIVEIETDGWWDIKPPINRNYRAWIYSSKINYIPGDYIFAVYVDGEPVRSFDFKIVRSRNGGENAE